MRAEPGRHILVDGGEVSPRATVSLLLEPPPDSRQPNTTSIGSTDFMENMYMFMWFRLIAVLACNHQRLLGKWRKVKDDDPVFTENPC